MAISQEANPNSRNLSELVHPEHLQPPMAAASANPNEAIIAVASRVSSQPLSCSDLVWGVFTAVSPNAQKRPQGINILLTADEHCIGREVEDTNFRIDSNVVSQFHCKIFKKKACNQDTGSSSGAFLIDTSTNGTYLNWEKLKRGSPKFEAELRHGDIVSFAVHPQHEKAFAFVYREVQSSVSIADGTVLKRKKVCLCSKKLGTRIKRRKGIDVGAPQGPVSLDEFRSLQCSNAELRTQVEEYVCNIDSLQNELLGAKKASAEEKNTKEDLKDKLLSALQSRIQANEIIESQKASMAELQTQLDEERDQRKKEREKELKRSSDAASMREIELQEVIHKLQESERESSSLVESLRPKLEEARQKLVLSENKAYQLEAQLFNERVASDLRKKRIDEVEIEIGQMRRELEKEKTAREEAGAKVSALELEINEIVLDLETQKQRLKGAKERKMLRETQLDTLYSTTEEIQMLFAKQHEKLKIMERTLEDEEDYNNVSLKVSINEASDIHDVEEFVTEPDFGS